MDVIGVGQFVPCAVLVTIMILKGDKPIIATGTGAIGFLQRVSPNIMVRAERTCESWQPQNDPLVLILLG